MTIVVSLTVDVIGPGTGMSRSRRSFSAEFKDELCREVIELSKPISEVAKVYGVGDDSLASVAGEVSRRPWRQCGQ